MCSEFEVDNWIISEFVIKELVPIVGIHPYPLNELIFMVSAVCRLKPTHIFEWGTHVGKSARIFYEITKYFHITSEIHSIDLPDNVQHCEHPQQNRGLLVKNIRDVQLHQGDGITVAIDLYKRINGKPTSLFFLDGDHEYRSVKRELTSIMKHALHASILIHDTFYQSKQSGYNTGPYKAIRESLRAKSTKYRMLSTNLGLPGMTLLYIPTLL
ncbi:MAG: class I SAM-dependent methyltransferase [bacterium]